MPTPSTNDYINRAAAIENLANPSLLRPNPKLDNVLSNSDKNGLLQINVSPLQGQFLKLQCQLMGAKNVLEVGTLGGYSTIWFAEAGAKVTSIELSAKHYEVAKADVAGLDADLILGDALQVLPRLVEEGRCFDFVFIDADWDHHCELFNWDVKLTRPRGCVYVDNVVKEMLWGDTLDGKRDSLVTRVGRDDRVEATLVPTTFYHEGLRTMSDDMFDGFLIAMVK